MKMKAHKFIKRDRLTAGRATGDIICRFIMPDTDEAYDLRVIVTNPSIAFDSIRKFVNGHLQKRFALLDNAGFAIIAEIRASNGGLRRKKLAIWKFDDELEPVFKKASEAFKLLELEEDWGKIEIDI